MPTADTFDQQHADRKVIPKIDYTGNFDEEGNATMCLIIKDAKNKRNLKSIIILVIILNLLLI